MCCTCFALLILASFDMVDFLSFGVIPLLIFFLINAVGVKAAYILNIYRNYNKINPHDAILNFYYLFFLQ